ncbi:MAG: hypothetical protein Alpg2KO_18460 [Alphaproteobacteria bacterium]
MTTFNDTKPIWQSKTILAAVAQVLAAVLTGLFGIDWDAGMTEQLTELLVLIGGLITGGLTFWGRVSADKTVTLPGGRA